MIRKKNQYIPTTLLPQTIWSRGIEREERCARMGVCVCLCVCACVVEVECTFCTVEEEDAREAWHVRLRKLGLAVDDVRGLAQELRVEAVPVGDLRSRVHDVELAARDEGLAQVLLDVLLELLPSQQLQRVAPLSFKRLEERTKNK